MGSSQSKQSEVRFNKLKTEALHLQEQGRYSQALKIYSEIIELSKDPHGTQVVPQKEKVQEINREAIKYMTQSLEMQRTADKYCILADLHNQMEQPNKAIQNYSKALEIKQSCVEEQTKQFLQKSIAIKQLSQVKQIVGQSSRIEQMVGVEKPKDLEQLLDKTTRDISVILKYEYDETTEKMKEQCLAELQNMMKKVMERVTVLQQQNKKLKEEQNHFYKNYQLLFNESMQNSTLSPENQDILKTYFGTFCSKMELFYQSMKLLNKIPDSDLSLEEIYSHVQDGQETLIQIQKKLKGFIDHLQSAKSVLDQIPYVSIIFAVFRQFDKYFNKYVENVHDEHKIGHILSTWMNSQVFNDFAADVAFRITTKMKLRILNHSEPSFKNYLKVLWKKLIKIYRYKNEAAKLKQLQAEHYNRKAYTIKLAERDAAIVFYSFEMQRLKRKTDVEEVANDIVHLIEQFDGMKIEELTPAKPVEKQAQTGRRCLLF